ncbi:hypothetical protein [Streptomyces halstedii]|uniref:hypothetical protein n=1 Tax=Streptomyces halstedii TaxID=1944 RepID=UPI00335A10EA
MTSPSRPASTDLTPSTGRPAAAASSRAREALEARDALAVALTEAGVQLPAMDVRTPWLDGDPEAEEGDGGRPPRYALVHLGVCSAPVALELAAVIRKGAAR